MMGMLWLRRRCLMSRAVSSPPAAGALQEAGITPIALAEKEGLALINGTDGMLGMLVLACADLGRLLRTADVAAAMSVEAQLGTDSAFAPDLQALRPHPGQAASAANLCALVAGSDIMASHRGPECTRVQDAYSLRCSPQVHGAARDTLAHAELVAWRELAAVVDNPVVTPDGRVESNGNFHGAPIGYVLDFLAIAVADVASISERRTDRFLDPARSHGLPPFLADDAGVDSGHMIAQYTQAGIVSELKRLAVPASVDSIPSSAMQEDHVSMGWAAGRKLRRALDGLTRVVAIEVLTAGRAIDLRAPLATAPATGAVRDGLRRHVPGPGADRHLAPEIEAAVAYVASGQAVMWVDVAVARVRAAALSDALEKYDPSLDGEARLVREPELGRRGPEAPPPPAQPSAASPRPSGWRWFARATNSAGITVSMGPIGYKWAAPPPSRRVASSTTTACRPPTAPTSPWAMGPPTPRRAPFR